MFDSISQFNKDSNSKFFRFGVMKDFQNERNKNNLIVDIKWIVGQNIMIPARNIQNKHAALCYGSKQP